MNGTNFQIKVWKALQNIPYGQTANYSEIAEAINHPKAVRAVANAIGANPLLIFVPCHRVIGKDGSLTGFRAGIKLKKQRSEEHTSELQSRGHLVCRLLLEKKKHNTK